MAAKREYNVAAISKMLLIMDYLMENPGAEYPDLCENLDIPNSSLYQILQALVQNRLVRRDSDRKHYIGFRMFEYGQTAVKDLDIRRSAHPIMKGLAKRTELTVHLGILNEASQGVFLDRVDGGAFTFSHTQVGAGIRMETSATGRALIAWETPKRRDELISLLNFDNPQGGIASKEEYSAACEKARGRGYVIDEQESQPNINGIGVPIYNYTGRVCGAIALGGLDRDLNESNYDYYYTELKKAAEEISAELGKRPC